MEEFFNMKNNGEKNRLQVLQKKFSNRIWFEIFCSFLEFLIYLRKIAFVISFQFLVLMRYNIFTGYCLLTELRVYYFEVNVIIIIQYEKILKNIRFQNLTNEKCLTWSNLISKKSLNFWYSVKIVSKNLIKISIKFIDCTLWKKI